MIQTPQNNKKTILISYTIIFLISYCFLPYLFLIDLFGESATLLSQLTIVSCICVLLGGFLSFKNKVTFKKILFNYDATVKFVFGLFLFYIVLVFATAEKIPFIESLKGTDPKALADMREKFLKARVGWQYSFVYVNAFLSGALVPYLICMGFPIKYKYRYLMTIIFLLYCISFSEKAFFLRIALPLFYYFYSQAPNKKAIIIKWTSAMLTLLIIMTALGGVAEEGNEDASFFEKNYIPTDPITKTAWRIVVIPVVTANDALRTFKENYGGQYFYGNTSTLFTLINGKPKIEFEREVFMFQYGRNEDGTGTANSVYVTEGYVNFGLLGVIIFSLIVGILISFFAESKDIALQGMSVLFVYNMFNGSLIATIISNGYLFIIMIALFVKFKYDKNSNFIIKQ